MRRMYGDQRHGHVLRVELQEELSEEDPMRDWQPPARKFPRYSRYDHEEDRENEVLEDEDFFFENYGEPRFLRDDVKNDDVLNTKFVYSEEPAIAIKLAGLKTAPLVRPTTQKSNIERISDKFPVKKEDEITNAADTTSKLEQSSTTITVEETTISLNEENSTTETTTDQTSTTPNVVEADDRVGESAEGGFSSTESSEVEAEQEEFADGLNKPGAILFQDMEDPSKKKVHVNYKMRGV